MKIFDETRTTKDGMIRLDFLRSRRNCIVARSEQIITKKNSRAQRTFSLPNILKCAHLSKKQRPKTTRERRKKAQRHENSSKNLSTIKSSSMIVQKISLRDQVVASNEAWLEYSIEKAAFRLIIKLLKLLSHCIISEHTFFLE